MENDQTPPASPANFGSRTTTPGLVSLGWTAPGDDGTEGNCSSYELRVSNQPITDEASFQRANLIPTGRPQASGQEENVRVELTPSGNERPLYFGLKAVDNAGNASDLSTLEVRVPAARVAFEDNLDGGAEKWTAQGTWAQVEVAGRGKVWTDSPGGNYGNKKDWSVTTQRFSLKESTGTRLYFDLKHQIEERHDNLFVEASSDGGRKWSPLANYTGKSDWKKESVDLSAFDGKDVQIRFRLKTDRSITGDGVYFDNVVVAAGNQ
jgi:bacillopeptidase F